MSRVFLIETNQRYALETAESYGSLVYLCDFRVNPFNTIYIVALVRAKLDEYKFDPLVDCICMTGQTIKVAILLAVVAAKYAPHPIRVLMFNATVGNYVERLFDVNSTLPLDIIESGESDDHQKGVSVVSEQQG